MLNKTLQELIDNSSRSYYSKLSYNQQSLRNDLLELIVFLKEYDLVEVEFQKKLFELVENIIISLCGVISDILSDFSNSFFDKMIDEISSSFSLSFNRRYE